MNDTVIEVVGAAIRRGDTIFAAQRGPGKTLAGMWEFPGGKIEPGETPQQALAREIREELDSVVEVGPHIATATFEYSFGTVRLSTYYCTLVSGELTLSEHQAAVWQPTAHLDQLEWTPADEVAVRTIMSDCSANQ